MGNKKISGMDLIAVGDVVALDMIEILDVSDTTDAPTGTNKRLSIADYLVSKLPGTAAVAASLAASADTTITTGATYQPIEGTFNNDVIVGFEAVSTPAIKYTSVNMLYFEVDWHGSVSCDSNGITVHCAIKKNGVLVTASVMGTYLKIANEAQALSGTAVVSLATDDEIQLVVTATTTGDVVTVKQFTTTIRQFLIT